MNILELYKNLILSSIVSLNSSQSGGNKDVPVLLVITKGYFLESIIFKLMNTLKHQRDESNDEVFIDPER